MITAEKRHKNKAKRRVEEVLRDSCEPKDALFVELLEDLLAQYHALHEATEREGIVGDDGELHPAQKALSQVRAQLLPLMKEASLTPSRTQKAGKEEVNPISAILAGGPAAC